MSVCDYVSGSLKEENLPASLELEPVSPARDYPVSAGGVAGSARDYPVSAGGVAGSAPGSPRPTPTVPDWQREEEAEMREERKRRADEMGDILLRRKKLSTVAMFISVMNELDSNWKSDAGLLKRTKKWAERAATD